MPELPKYRHELKYVIGPPEYYVLRSRLAPVMSRDRHVSADGSYLIRSIYFDNIEDKALREKLCGVPLREKFRIRCYNDDLGFLILEKKIKHNELCMKIDAQITVEECREILARNTSLMLKHPSGLVRELGCKMNYQQLRPRVLVSYRREPFVYAPGNVRVTFDSQLRSTLWHGSFLDEKVYDISALDSPGEIILEVKYDAFLPDTIACLLQTGLARQQAFSKYGACRRFG